MNLLWSHARGIVINAFKDKTMYYIPLAFDEERRLTAVRTYEAIVQNGTLIITETIKDESQSPTGRRPRTDYP